MPVVAVGLVRHLQRVAPVAEQTGAVRQDQPEPGRPGEAADEGETLFTGRHLFALEHVLAADKPAIQPARRKKGTKAIQPV